MEHCTKEDDLLNIYLFIFLPAPVSQEDAEALAVFGLSECATAGRGVRHGSVPAARLGPPTHSGARWRSSRVRDGASWVSGRQAC